MDKSAPGTADLSSMGPYKRDRTQTLSKTSLTLISAALFSALPVACDQENPEQSPPIAMAAPHPEPAAAKVENLTCPVHPDQAIADDPAPGQLAQHKGHSIGFCSDRCAGEWARWSDARKASFLDLIAGADPR